MPKSDPILTNVTAGELDPHLKGRPDLDKYFNGCETLENFIANPYGNSVRPSGTYFVGNNEDRTKKTRLIPFQFSTIQNYHLEFGDYIMRVIKDSGRVLETDQNITGATQADPCVLTVTAHPFSDGDWVYASGLGGMTEVNGKYYIVANQATNTIELTDLDGNNVDSSAFTAYTSGGTVAKVYQIATPYSEDDLAGLKFVQDADLMYFAHPDYSPRELTRTAHTSWTLTEAVFDEPAFLSENSTTTTITPSATTGTITLTASTALFNANMVGGYFKVQDGWVLVTVYNSTTDVTGTVESTALSGTTADAAWRQGAWSEDQGFPAAVGFIEQRLGFAGTSSKPQTGWLSQSGEYKNFGYNNADPSDAIMFTVASTKVNRIRWIYSTPKGLVVGTVGEIFPISSGSTTEAITPSNIYVAPAVNYGVADIMPERIGSYLFYVQFNEKILRDFGYSFDTDSFKAKNRTILAGHILSTGVKETAYVKHPFDMLWCVLDDGNIAVMTYEEDQSVLAWSRLTTTGNYESISVIPNGSEDQIMVVVNRTINSVQRRFIEYFKPFDWGTDQDDIFFVHSGLTYDGSATTSITGLDHLEGEEVQICADGAKHPNKTVTSGAITLDASKSVVHVGLGYTSTYKSMEVESGSARGTSQGKKKRIRKVITRLYKTLGGKVGDEDNQDSIVYREGSDTFDTAIPLFTGIKPIVPPTGWDRQAHIVIKQDEPLPMTILSSTIQMQTNDG